MITRGVSLAAAAVLMAGLAACVAPEPEDAAESPVEASASAILGGRPVTDHPEAVLVDIQRGGQTVMGCSGALVAPRVVLTAGHCVADAEGFQISAPYAGGQWAHASGSVVYDWTQTNNQVSPDEHDVALVLLDAPIRLRSYPSVASRPLPEGAAVVSVGRVRGGELSQAELFTTGPLAIRSGAPEGFGLDYAAAMHLEHGDSGGPSYAAGTRTIVAVSSTGDDRVQLVARVDLVSAWIRQQIARSPAR